MDKNIILISTQNDIYRKNNQSSFQNKLFKHNYLDPETSYCISPKSISIDMQFVNPACAEDSDYPAFIACPLSRISKVWKKVCKWIKKEVPKVRPCCQSGKDDRIPEAECRCKEKS